MDKIKTLLAFPFKNKFILTWQVQINGENALLFVSELPYFKLLLFIFMLLRQKLNTKKNIL